MARGPQVSVRITNRDISYPCIAGQDFSRAIPHGITGSGVADLYDAGLQFCHLLHRIWLVVEGFSTIKGDPGSDEFKLMPVHLQIGCGVGDRTWNAGQESGRFKKQPPLLFGLRMPHVISAGIVGHEELHVEMLHGACIRHDGLQISEGKTKPGHSGIQMDGARVRRT